VGGLVQQGDIVLVHMLDNPQCGEPSSPTNINNL
jgi:hypothetical protein